MKRPLSEQHVYKSRCNGEDGKMYPWQAFTNRFIKMPSFPNDTPISNGHKEVEEVVSYDINLPYRAPTEAAMESAKERTEFPAYLPTWDRIWFDDLPEFPYEDPALRAHGTTNLLKEGVRVNKITPKMGTILAGVKLEELDLKAKDELALLISERKIVVLRDQVSFLNAGET